MTNPVTPMFALQQYVASHAERGTCRCGKCDDCPTKDKQPSGHTIDLCFFEVSARHDPDAKTLRAMVASLRGGVFCQLDLLDGKEHSYIEVGGWIGDQGTALMLMGLGAILGLWRVIQPKMMPGIPSDLVMRMAGMGYITIQAPGENNDVTDDPVHG